MSLKLRTFPGILMNSATKACTSANHSARICPSTQPLSRTVFIESCFEQMNCHYVSQVARNVFIKHLTILPTHILDKESLHRRPFRSASAHWDKYVEEVFSLFLRMYTMNFPVVRIDLRWLKHRMSRVSMEMLIFTIKSDEIKYRTTFDQSGVWKHSDWRSSYGPLSSKDFQLAVRGKNKKEVVESLWKRFTQSADEVLLSGQVGSSRIRFIQFMHKIKFLFNNCQTKREFVFSCVSVAM